MLRITTNIAIAAAWIGLLATIASFVLDCTLGNQAAAFMGFTCLILWIPLLITLYERRQKGL